MTGPKNSHQLLVLTIHVVTIKGYADHFWCSQGEIVVSSETNAHDSTDPVELWKDWNETTARTMSSNLNREKVAYTDPSGFYYIWMYPATSFGQWYSATGEAWMRMIGEVANPARFLEVNYQFIEASMSMVRASLLVNEAMLQHLQMPTRSDIARVAEHVVSLEERVCTIEDAFVNFEDDCSHVATGRALERLAGGLERVEGKLNLLQAALEKITATTPVESVRSDDGGEAVS